MKYTDQNDSGFGLIQAAIAMMFVGLVIGAILTIFRQEDVRNIRIENEEKMNAITDAIAKFIYQNGRYPCPASIIAVPGDNNFGDEDCTTVPGSTHTGNGKYFSRGPFNVTEVHYGSVPVTTLGLPMDFILDAYDRRFSYAVSHVQAIPPGGVMTPGSGQIQVWRPNPGAVFPAPPFLSIKANADFVLISHGPDRKGAYPLEGNFGGAGGSVQAPPVDCVSGGSTFSMGPDYARGASFPPDGNNCYFTSLSPVISRSQFGAYVDAPYSEALPAASNNMHFDDTIVYNLALKDTSLWRINPNATTNEMDVMLRHNAGGVAIGANVPGAGEKLRVDGGNVIIRDDGSAAGANVDAGGLSTQNITASGDVKGSDVIINGVARGILFSSGP